MILAHPTGERMERLPTVGFMTPPIPADRVWARRFMTALWEADCAARTEHGLPVHDRRAFHIDAHIRKSRARTTPSPRGVRTGVCCGCGCAYDDETPGCQVCYGRHAVRRHLDRKRKERNEHLRP